MTSNLQLVSFIVSFIFGIMFYFLTYINFKLLKNLKLFIQHILTLVYVLDMIIIYIIIFYKLNKGYFHIYFLFIVILGFIVGYIINKKYLSKIIVNRIKRN